MTTNVDRAELEKFSALASRWWDPNSEFRPLHQINPLRLDWIDHLARLNTKRVVDVGCGGGRARRAVLGCVLVQELMAAERREGEGGGDR